MYFENSQKRNTAGCNSIVNSNPLWQNNIYFNLLLVAGMNF